MFKRYQSGSSILIILFVVIAFGIIVVTKKSQHDTLTRNRALIIEESTQIANYLDAMTMYSLSGCVATGAVSMDDIYPAFVAYPWIKFNSEISSFLIKKVNNVTHSIIELTYPNSQIASELSRRRYHNLVAQYTKGSSTIIFTQVTKIKKNLSRVAINRQFFSSRDTSGC